MFDYDQKRNLEFLQKFVLPECSRGNKRYLGALQSVFVYEDEKELQIRAAAINEEILSRLSVRELVWLSNHFIELQNSFLYAYHMEFLHTGFTRERFWHLSDGQYDTLLKLGTLMADGHGRQECMERISNAHGALPFLLLRMNDWVQPIRESAYVLVGERLNACSLYELLCALPILEKIGYAGRRSADRLHALQEQIGYLIGQRFDMAAQEELDAVFCCDSFVRNAICRFVYQNRVLRQDQMERLLSLEKAGYGKRLLLLGIFRHYGCSREKLKAYLQSKSAVVRYHALLYCFEEEQNAWDGLEEMLLDTSKRIREYAAYILTKCKKVNIIEYYIQELHTRVSKTALLGIGENGTGETGRELALVIPFLESEDEQIRKAALTAYGRLAAESGDAVYWRFLSGSDAVLARQAYRLICKYQIAYHAQDMYCGFVQNRGSLIGECFLKLLLRAPSWQRLPYLLQLYCDTGLSDAWRNRILEKMCYRNPYAKISGQQAQEICDILEQYKQRIPQGLSEGIRFDLKYVTK